MESAGLWMLLAVAVLMVTTGLPAYMVLIGVASLAATIGVLAGEIPIRLLQAVPTRIIGLLESDLLQALPLYVLMGVLLDRLPLADIMFRAGVRLGDRSAAAPTMTALGLGALLAPMSGSVGASVAALGRTIHPRLIAAGVPADRSLATICVASTFGVVIPPSLVLILLGDAMLRAHTEALNISRKVERIINTQDVLYGALVPAGLFLLLCLGLAWFLARHDPAEHRTRLAPVRGRDWLIAGFTVTAILGLLAAVAIGYLYAVEAAAAGGVALFLFGTASGALRGRVLAAALRDVMAVTGALFALFVAATTFTLVFRTFGTDRVLDQIIGQLPGGAVGSTLIVLGLIALCAFVLDAFEIIFVIIPVTMPPLLARGPDAIWVATLTLLALQASFLVPPIGYAIMMARGATSPAVPLARLLRAILPFLAVQLLVLTLVAALPASTRLIGRGLSAETLRSTTVPPGAAVRSLNDALPQPPED